MLTKREREIFDLLMKDVRMTRPELAANLSGRAASIEPAKSAT